MSGQRQISIAIQGGGARVAYALGALREIRAAEAVGVSSFSCSSSGAFAALAYLTQDVDFLTEKLFEVLSSKRFLNPYRFTKVADFDYLIRDVLGPLLDLSLLNSDNVPDIWVSLVDAQDGALTYRRMTEDTALELLLATNAFPILYGRRISIGTDRDQRYIDGGVGDPLPLLHALSRCSSDTSVVAIATKPLSLLAADFKVGLPTRLAIHLDRRISRDVRHRLLSPNPLVALTLMYATIGTVGQTEIATCEPSDRGSSFSRTAVEPDHLLALHNLGETDMRACIDTLLRH